MYVHDVGYKALLEPVTQQFLQSFPETLRASLQTNNFTNIPKTLFSAST